MALIIYGVSIVTVIILTLIVWSVIYRDDGVLLRKEIALGILAMVVSFAPVVGTIMAVAGVVMLVTWMLETNEFNITTWLNQPAISSSKDQDDDT